MAEVDGVIVLLPLHLDVRHHEPRPFELVCFRGVVRHFLHPLQLIPRLGHLAQEHVTGAHREDRRNVIRLLDDYVAKDVQRLCDAVLTLAHHTRVALQYYVPGLLTPVGVHFREE